MCLRWAFCLRVAAGASLMFRASKILGPLGWPLAVLGVGLGLAWAPAAVTALLGVALLLHQEDG